MKEKDLGLTYREALHGVQSAIAFEIGQGDCTKTTPKHLRVGVDSSHISHLGLGQLLIDKGIFTAEEYEEYMRLAANAELYDYEKIYKGITFR